MDELRLLRELGDETPLATPVRLAPARARLLAAMPDTAAPAARSRHRARPRWRLVLGGLAAAGVAAAVTSVLVLAPDQVGGDVPVAKADATRVLHSAAAAALRLPDAIPNPDQYIYQRSQDGPELYESWRSVDGTRDGLIRKSTAGATEEITLPGCRNGRAAVVKGGQVVPNQTEPCTPERAYRADLPTDTAAMRVYLTEHRSGEPGSVNAFAKDVLVLAQDYLRPQSRAALYEAAAQEPGLRAVENVRDGAGRPGVGVAWPSTTSIGPDELVLVFHAETYAYLGMAGSSAVLDLAIVSQVGQTG
ncbi:CU044_5270 family protein [Micromonospora sp. NBC_01796]|uniref:CU044_5270 family protein n=1 Tax=Micromonospora sp. NBC_01796 TaxID=2975987 RepID=UPI002DD9D1DA|nr:CU044_5270 family protein [Micromonospora sp. NBC_01796]WSA88303.1 CU044_5270 family protein [Micromonospora sp. NBC_01796]